MSKIHEKTKPKQKQTSNNPEKCQKENNNSHKNKIQIPQEEERTKKGRISIKDQNAKDKFEYEVFKERSKLLSDYYAPNITLKNLNITLRCLSCYKIPKIRFNYPNFKVFISCPKHRKSLSYQEFLEKGYNNDLINMPCCKCGKKHNYMVRGSFYICLQCNKIFCPECSTKKEKCQAYYNNNTNSKKEKKNIYINNNEEQQSKTHILIKLDIYDNKCHLHQVNQFSLYCLDCQCELCSRCQESHTKGHKIRSLTKYTVNNKFIEVCLSRVKNEKDNIELVEKYIEIFSDKNYEELRLKNSLKNDIEQDKLSLEIKNRILISYKDKKSNYNSIRNVKKLKYPWINSINPKVLDKIKDKKEIYKYLNIYLLEGNLNEEQTSSNENNSQDDSDSSEDNISFLDLPENKNNGLNVNKNKDYKINICFNNDTNEINENNNTNNIIKNKKNKKEKSKEKNIEDNSKKNLIDMKNFLVEQDEITIECLLGLKNSNFAMGLRSGDLNIYKNDINQKNYPRLLKISEHKSGINSLFEISNNSILTASSDRYLKKIKLSNDNKSYKVEYIFNLHTSSVYKGIELKTKNILSCGINDYLMLWVHNPKYSDEETFDNDNDNNDMYSNIQIPEAGQGITDIIEMKNSSFACASDILQFWNFFSESEEEKENKEKYEKEKEETKMVDKNNKIINDSSESQFSYQINQIINNNKFDKVDKTDGNNNNKKEERQKIYINKNEYYEKKGYLELKTSSSNCLCKLNSRFLIVILSEENLGKLAIVDSKKVQCLNIIQISNYELTSITNFNADSIIVCCTEKKDECYIVYIKQYQISNIFGLDFVGQKTKKLSEYYIKPNEKNKKTNSINNEFAKKIREQINCIAYTTGGLLICSGKIESPERTKIIGEIDLFI